MKCLIINLIIFAIVVNSEDANTRKSLLLPQLPVGKYRLNFLTMMRCASVTSNNKNQLNLYISKKSSNTTEIKGNITNFVQLDDSLTVEMNMEMKESIGGWKDNAYFYKSIKACSSLKMFLGNAWKPIMEGLGIYKATCPLPVGIFNGPGINTDAFKSSNFPKTFFYGTYRVRISFTKNNEVYGCLIVVLEIKRPWETNN